MAAATEDYGTRDRMADFARALRSDTQNATCDFELVCSGATFSVHRLVLCMHSTYFKRLCESPFKENTEGKIILYDDPTPTVQALVQYLYEFTYDNPMKYVHQSNSYYPNPRNELHAHAQVFVLADKYDIPKLRRLAIEKFEDTLNYGDKAVRSTADAMVAVTPYIYEHTLSDESELRTALIQAWSGGNIFGYMRKNELHALMKDIPEFAMDVVSVLAGKKVGCHL